MKRRDKPADYELLVGDVHDLRAFAVVTDLRSLTAAGRLLGESTATVSRRITRLEAALKVTLLRRSPRRVEPTDDGTAYRARVGEILELLADANASVRQAHAAPSGHLRVTMAPGLESQLAPLIADFSVRYPDVIVDLMISNRFVDLDAEHVDVALRATTRLADSTLVAHRLFELERIALAAPSYLQANPALRRVDDLARHRVVHLGDLHGPTGMTLHKVDGSGEPVEVKLRAAVGSNDVGFARELAIAGAGVVILPRLAVSRELAEERLVHVLPSYVVPGAALYLLHRGGRFLAPKVRAFRDLLLHTFAPQRVRRGGEARA